jgi:hypothetical protein
VDGAAGRSTAWKATTERQSMGTQTGNGATPDLADFALDRAMDPVANV